MTSLTPINTIDRFGKNRTFKYKRESTTRKHLFRVYADPPLQSGDFFDFEVEAVDNAETAFKIVMMNHYLVEEYSGAGVPDAMIPEISRVLGKCVVSSSNKSRTPGEYRTAKATKVWDRLVVKGVATYDEATDSYECCA